MQFSRRTALALCAKAEDQAHQHPQGLTTTENFSFKFLAPAEVLTTQRFAALLIPPSDRNGGAAAAHVETYLDHVLVNAAPSLQRAWRSGLAAWAKAKDSDSHLALLAANEFQPKTSADQFFILFKTAITAAFHTSEEGILKELGYQGMGFLRQFPGYQGEAFTVPANYKPLLRSRNVANLFINDGAPFVAAGNQNHTLTILAFALRSSERIVQLMKNNTWKD